MNINLLKNIIKAGIFTLILFTYLYFIIFPKEPFKLFPSLLFVFILIGFPIYYLFVIKSDQGFGKIAIPLLSSFIGLFLALYVNGYYNYKKESEAYKSILITTQLEIDSNLNIIKQLEGVDLSKQKPINALTNSVISGTLQNPIFLKQTNSVDLMLLSFINKGIITCINHLNIMLNDKTDYDKNLSVYFQNLNSIRDAMIQFRENNKKTYYKFIEKLTKEDLQRLKKGKIEVDYNYKF